MDEQKYLVSLYAFTYFGPKRITLLLDYFGSPSAAWKASNKSLLEIGLSKKIVENFSFFKKSFKFEDYFSQLKQNKISYITITSNKYPKILKELDGAPIVLYFKGDVSTLSGDNIAIVGTRKATSYGKEVTEKFSKEISLSGANIVSGLALGIDSVAHRATFDTGGKTIAVLACGLDQIYPKINTQLANEIISKEGAIVSEYPLGHPALRPNFASRNRIISGLSKAVLVIEGAKKSGTLLTASHAADQGRQVFAVPGQITSPMSEASHFLIQNGAKIAFSPRDVIEELNMQFEVDKAKMEKVLPETLEEIKIVKVLENEEMHLDELVRITRMATDKIISVLTIMELKGIIKNLGNGNYKKN